MAFGTTGFAAAVTLLMVLSPAAGAAVPLKVYAPAYKHTVSQSGTSVSQSGCGKAKATLAAWHALTGTVTAADSSSAKTCGKSLGYVGGSSSGFAESSIEVAIPFAVGHGGNNSIGSSFTVNVASSQSFTASACPAKNVNYNPALYQYSYGYCEAGVYTSFSVSASVQDLNNNSWYAHNYSYAYSFNESGWENYTDCYNYGTPSCSNTTGPFGYAYSYGYNDPGFSTFTLNGATSFSLWTNGTMMVKGHHYVLIVSLYVYGEAFADQANLLGPWSGSALATINMATLGNGATLNSLTVT